MENKSKVAVIGLGNIGTIVASNLVRSNRSVIVADRTKEKADQLAQKLGKLVKADTVAKAIEQADIVVLAVYFNTIKEMFEVYREQLRGKIIIDPSNPIAPDENGGFKKIIEKDESAGQILSALLPEGARLVKALGTLGAASLENAAFQAPDKAVLFYAGDDINEEVEWLIHDMGFAPLFIGGHGQSIRIEVFGDLHEFGGLGKTITLADAGQVA